MAITDPDLDFIRIISNKESVDAGVRAQVLGTEWKARTEPDMIRHAEWLLELGNRHLKSCMDIVKKIRIQRAAKHREGRMTLPPVNFVLHDEISGFDSEAGVGGAGTIAVNLCTNAGWIDKNGNLWYVPILLIIYHELGHYLQYVTNPADYEAKANSEAAGGPHLLDAANLPDNEYPICREISMGIREQYLDMHELNHPDFANLQVNYSNRIPRDKPFQYAVEPEHVRLMREAEEKRKLDSRGVVAGGGQCQWCSKSFPSTVKKMMHEAKCPSKGHPKL